jgi:hypothetical protein
MNTRLCRECRRVVLALTASGWTAGVALAQTPDQRPMTPPSLAAVVNVGVALGDVVYVTDITGKTIKGTLAALTEDTVQVKARADVRGVAAAKVRRIQWPDSPLNGVLIGAAVGAIPGIYWLAVDPNECTGMCPEEYMLIGVGAVVGGVIDHIIRRTVTVYAAETSNERMTRVTVGPLLMRNRKGVQVAVKF